MLLSLAEVKQLVQHEFQQCSYSVHIRFMNGSYSVHGVEGQVGRPTAEAKTFFGGPKKSLVPRIMAGREAPCPVVGGLSSKCVAHEGSIRVSFPTDVTVDTHRR